MSDTEIYPLLKQRLTLFAQANIALTEEDVSNTITAMDILEMIEIFRDDVIGQLSVERVNFMKGAPKASLIAGGVNKYQNDIGYSRFWNDVEASVNGMVEQYFLRPITLSGKTKLVPHPMSKRFGPLIVSPTIDHFLTQHPDDVQVGTVKFFHWMYETSACTEVRTHDDDVNVARRQIVQITKNKGNQRLRVIRCVAKNKKKT